MPLEVRLLPSTEPGDRGAVSLDVNISKRWLPGPQGRHSWVIKTGKKLLKGFACQRSSERIYNCKFSKENALGKGRSGPGVRKKPMSRLIKLRGTFRLLGHMHA